MWGHSLDHGWPIDVVISLKKSDSHLGAFICPQLLGKGGACEPLPKLYYDVRGWLDLVQVVFRQPQLLRVCQHINPIMVSRHCYSSLSRHLSASSSPMVLGFGWRVRQMSRLQLSTPLILILCSLITCECLPSPLLLLRETSLICQ